MNDMQHAHQPILIVDDEVGIRSTLAQILEQEGYDVSVVRSGPEALAYLQRADPLPCLILLDLVMPEMTGSEFLRQQRADPALADIPVVVMSANLEFVQATHILGVNEYLYKPFDLDSLLSTVIRHCGLPPAGQSAQ